MKPQVSVRRAGLGAATRLLREMSHETAIAELWVRAALPLVRCTAPAASYCHDIHC